MPSPLPPGWLDHREFIERIGVLTDPDNWRGTELRALPRSAYEREVEEIDDETAAQVYRDRVQSGIDQAHAAVGLPSADDGPPCVVCGEPHAKIINGQHYCAEHGRPLPIPAVLRAKVEMPGLRVSGDDEIAAAGREIIRAEIDAFHEPERLARERWNRAYARGRDAVSAGPIKPAVWCLGELTWPPSDEILAHYPGPRELRVELPSLPVPGLLAFPETDVERAFGAKDDRLKHKRKPDPRSKRDAMIKGLEKALTAGKLSQNKRVTLAAAHGAMLDALGHREVPAGMGDDAFAKHCKTWLKEHGIYD